MSRARNRPDFYHFPQKNPAKTFFPLYFRYIKKNFFQKFFLKTSSVKKPSKIFFQEFSPQKKFFMTFTRQVRMKEEYHTKSDKI